MHGYTKVSDVLKDEYIEKTIRDKRATSRGPWGEVPISSVFGYEYPLKSSWDSGINLSGGRYGNLNDCVDYLIRSSRANSVSRLDDPYYTGVCSDLSYWPMARESSPNTYTTTTNVGGDTYTSTTTIRETTTPIRARSLSPFREYSPFRETTPIRQTYDIPVYPSARAAITPSFSPYTSAYPYRSTTPGPDGRNSSISYTSTTPWNTTGFYYSPRYPEAYRGTSSTYTPYSYARRYYDYDITNPNRIEYFKYPSPRKDYGYVPYKYSRKHMLTRCKI